MSITKDQVKHVAKLANLSLTSEEEEKYADQLSRILEYIDQLNSVDTSDVSSVYNVSGQTNVLAKDEPRSCFTQEEALSNASKKRDGFFVTKGVFND